MHEIIAEKLRALLQQPIRNRNRRQDVYDIAYLIEENELSDEDRHIILETLIKKCQTHGIKANVGSIDNPEVRQRAEADWNTLALELGELPPFDERFAMMRELYVSLPWQDLDVSFQQVVHSGLIGETGVGAPVSRASRNKMTALSWRK